MSKHTPGPWFAVGAQVEIEDDSVPDICTCDPQVMRQSHLDWHPRTVEANARLIAAAPELLEALEMMLACTEGQAIYNFMEPQREKARAAIAKAKGE
jgi:hypothetical protein